MTLDQDMVADIVYLSILGGVIGGAAVFFCFAILDAFAGALVRSLERHRARVVLARTCERLPDEGAH